MSKTRQQREKDAILTVLKHSGELPYGDIVLRGGENLADTLLVLVKEGKVTRRQDPQLGTLYSLASQTVEEVIKRLVAEAPAIKATTLVVEVIDYLKAHDIPTPTNPEGIPGVINDMVEAGELVELEYVLSDMDYRIKSLYFPKGTKLAPQS